MKRPFIFLALMAILLCSCHSTRKIQSPVVVASRDTVNAVSPVLTNHAKEDSILFIKGIYQSMQANRINFTSFSGKIDLDYEDGNGNKYNVNAHVRMYKDSVIWLSITAILGIEGLRVLITADSVKVLDKQNKVYKARSISFLQELTALPLDLPALQDLLIGNPVFLDPNIRSYSRSGTAISLYSQNTFFTNLTTINEADKLLQSSKLDDLDLQKNRTCYLTWSDYENKKGVNFPQKRNIHIIEKAKLDIKMDYKQYEFNEKLSFPFSVPKNYDQN
jgi:hypothetical protein